MPRVLLRLSLMLLLWPGTAALAADVGIAAFQGVWRGNAVSESQISANFKMTSRDIDVTVRTDADGGFAITWNTVQRQKGDPNNPREELKSTKMQFTPARPGVWRAAANADPLDSPAPFAWAFLKDRTLHIVSLRIYADGRHETQTYRRTLSGTGMALEFIRDVDGEQVRRASGRLIKVAK
ncbi:MAG: hypothetical protein ISR50_07040 [Alphaproteobacteria bacterium]|nr:hypothetical protein [Alphaproteobacteria bacterium]